MSTAPQTITARTEAWPIRGSFRIARGAKTEAHVVSVEIRRGSFSGRGECVPYARYAETLESVLEQLQSLPQDITRAALQTALPAGAARNAVDCALWDIEAKESGSPVHKLAGLPEPRIVKTAFTLSLDTPDAMGAAARDAAAKGYDVLKLKVAGAGDIERVEAVRRAAPAAQLIVDANEGWSEDDLARLVPPLAQLSVALIEQPLPAGRDDALHDFASPIPICADESCHTRADLPRLVGRYGVINVKLDKAGGLTEAITLTRAAQDMGFEIMLGCMVSTSLSMAPAVLLAPLARYVDLDGPLLLARDREPALTYDGNRIHPPGSELWG
jgi:L-alanine-DL-glutamate epimerase-like enolase superfamily enzyme